MTANRIERGTRCCANPDPSLVGEEGYECLECGRVLGHKLPAWKLKPIPEAYPQRIGPARVARCSCEGGRYTHPQHVTATGPGYVTGIDHSSPIVDYPRETPAEAARNARSEEHQTTRGES